MKTSYIQKYICGMSWNYFGTKLNFKERPHKECPSPSLRTCECFGYGTWDDA